MDTKEYLASLFSLEGKVIIVTGAAGGIGSAIAKGLAQAGATVIVTGRTLEKCEKVAAEITEAGGKCEAMKLDVADLKEIQAVVDQVIAKYEKIDVLFNVAGINKRVGVLDFTEEDYDRIMNVNMKGVYFMSQAVGREMYKRRSGNIINIGSHNDTQMLGGCSVYGAAKSGVIALTRALAVEGAQYGVRCNAISPGHIMTELTIPNWTIPGRVNYLKPRISMERGGMPEELVGVSIWLASDSSSYMTGQAVHVDGGCLAGGAPWEYDTEYK